MLSTSINAQTSFWFNMLHCIVPSFIPHNSIKACVEYYMICLFRPIAFSLYLVDVKGPRTNLLHIYYTCMTNDDNWRQKLSLYSVIWSAAKTCLHNLSYSEHYIEKSQSIYLIEDEYHCLNCT